MGAVVTVLKKSPNGWWQGEIPESGRGKGWFPANYVKVIGSGDKTPVPSMPIEPQPSSVPKINVQHVNSSVAGAKTEQVLALFDYTAQNSDELSFAKGSVINVVNKQDPDWWMGEVNGNQGLFPSNYVQSLNDAQVQGRGTSPVPAQWSIDVGSLSSSERKRQVAIQELVGTEEIYMTDMSLVMEVFQKPLVEGRVLTKLEANSIFVNWNQLIYCNKKLLKSLRVRRKMSSGDVITVVGDVLCENLPHFTPYIRFCSRQLVAAKLIQSKTETSPEFKAVHQQCIQDTRTKAMPLSSFLLKPMQRVTKYPLLIKKILEFTPDEHADYANLQEALYRAEELCSQVNEGVREQENSDKLEWIQTHVQCDGLPEAITFNSLTNCLGARRIVHVGVLYKVKSGKELVSFLFNDFLLLTQPSKATGGSFILRVSAVGGGSFKMYRSPFFLNEVVVRAPVEAEADECVFSMQHVDRTYTFRTTKITERNQWLRLLEETSQHYRDTEKKKQEKVHSHRQMRSAGVGRLLVTVVEGIDLKPSPNDTSGRCDPFCEVAMALQEHKTSVATATLNPRWNCSMQFVLRDLKQDVLCITVYDRDIFSPNEFMGRTEVRVAEVLRERKQARGPITKRLKLYEVDRGEIVVKLDVQVFETATSTVG